LLNETCIAQIDIEELLSEMMNEEFGDFADDVQGENPDNDELRDEYDDVDDDYTDYDEIEGRDPFEAEDVQGKNSPVYIAEVSFGQTRPTIGFLKVPCYDTSDVLVKNALNRALRRV